MSYLFHNLLHFDRLLRAAGLDVPAGRMPEVAAALGHIDIGRRSDFYFSLRTLLVRRHQDLPAFDEAFRLFWRRPPGEAPTMDLRALGERRQSGRPQVDFLLEEPDTPGDDRPARTLSRPIERIAPMSYSPRDVSRVKDFAEFTEDELRAGEAMLAALDWKPGMRRTRRWSAGAGTSIDLQRVIRRNARYGGEPIELPTRRRKLKPRGLVLLCDISGSMERYSRMLLHFIHSIAGGLDRVEVFLFSIRLTRVTREFERRRADEALLKVSGRISDWSSGTRIGEALRAFNLDWGRRIRTPRPVILLISDGWDRGEPDVLRMEMGRLRRTCHRLIWLNPLLGARDYRPLTRGMQAALPFVDDFLPVHNLASLEALAEHLNSLEARRRGQAANRSG